MRDSPSLLKFNQHNYFEIRGGGSSQDGSLRAEKILNDVNRAALEERSTRDLATLFVPTQHLKKKLFKCNRFSFVI